MMGRAVSHPPIRGPQRLAASVTEATRIGTRHSFSRRSIETMGANSLPKYSGSVTNVRDSVFPSLQRRGGRAIKKKSPFRKGADGVVAHRLHCGMRFETSRVSDHPVCAALVASQHLLMAQPPLLCKQGTAQPLTVVSKLPI